jgi:mitofusin
MLRDKILPTGIGHTTNCFLQVEGSDSNEDRCIYTPNNDSPQNIQVNSLVLYFIDAIKN